jgi:hypothetical protein
MHTIKRSPHSEAELDDALASALLNNREFALWFLSQTRFAAEEAECVQVRADNPYSSVRQRVPSGLDGALEELVQDRETDVLAVFVAGDGRRLALHIENKLASGSFTAYQAASYRERLLQWRQDPRLGMYVDATSVLVAPQVFYERNIGDAQAFEAFVSHEAIAEHLPAFASASAAQPFTASDWLRLAVPVPTNGRAQTQREGEDVRATQVARELGRVRSERVDAPRPLLGGPAKSSRIFLEFKGTEPRRGRSMSCVS